MIAKKGDNKDLIKIFNLDQRDRHPNNWYGRQDLVANRDGQRRRKVRDLLSGGHLKSGNDFFRAAMIFHHSLDARNNELAVKLASSAMRRQPDNLDFRWLFACTLDRLLRSQGLKQRYGTQFDCVEVSPGTYELRLEPYDLRVSDVTRQRMGVPKIGELLKMQVAC